MIELTEFVKRYASPFNKKQYLMDRNSTDAIETLALQKYLTSRLNVVAKSYMKNARKED